MIGLVIATHGKLAEELVAAAALIIGPSQRVRAVTVDQDSGIEEIRSNIVSAVEQVNKEHDGVIIMTDMFGGTPSNISITLLDPERVEVLAGINLPMVLKFFNSPDDLSLVELARMLKAYGQQSITIASDFLAS